MSQLTRDEIGDALRDALEAAQADGALPRLPAGQKIAVERAQRPEHGDYASSIALRLAGSVKRKPLEVAEAIASRVATGAMIASVEVAAPGFINVRLGADWKRAQVDVVLAAGAAWGDLTLGEGRRVQVEFVSANPTGPLHVANGRGAVLGDALANVLAAAGYDVEREYYINDAGTQARIFGQTLYVRYAQACGREVELPEDAYRGAYMADLAERIRGESGEQYLRPPGEDGPEALQDLGLQYMVVDIRGALAQLGVEFDHWFNETSLFEPRPELDDRSTYSTAMARLEEGGYVVAREGATWFSATQLGEDKDNVLVRRTKEPTYFAADVAYHFDKFVTRGFDRVIDVWGADHQGHVARTQAATEAVGGPPRSPEVLLYQLVHLRRDGKRMVMSKRTGEIVTLRELLDEVGKDATRYFMLQRSADAQMDFDMDVATSQDPKQNPVSYVQYAHARCAGLLRTGEEAKLGPDGDVQRLTEPQELALIGTMLRLPELVEFMATNLEPHHLTTYAMELAQSFTQFYEACRVVDVDVPELSRARLRLTLAAQTVLAKTLALIGVDAPEVM